MTMFKNIPPSNIRCGKSTVSYGDLPLQVHGYALMDENTNYNQTLSDEDWIMLRDNTTEMVIQLEDYSIHVIPLSTLNAVNRTPYSSVTHVNRKNNGLDNSAYLTYHENTGSNGAGYDYSLIRLSVDPQDNGYSTNTLNMYYRFGTQKYFTGGDSYGRLRGCWVR